VKGEAIFHMWRCWWWTMCFVSTPADKRVQQMRGGL